MDILPYAFQPCITERSTSVRSTILLSLKFGKGYEECWTSSPHPRYNKITSTSILTEHGLSPLLALPTELKLDIITYLYDDTSPNLTCLRRTHTFFLSITLKSDIRSKSSVSLLRSQILSTELNYPYLLPPDHYPCYGCTAVLPTKDFHPSERQRVLRIGKAAAYSRLCHRSCGRSEWTGHEVLHWQDAAWYQFSCRLIQQRANSSTPHPSK